MLYSSDDTVTKQFGFLKFNEDEVDENTRPSQYIRLALQTDAEAVVKFMKEAWRLGKPDLIISITGGAKYCDLSARLRKAFQVGLVAAAATTSKIIRNLKLRLINSLYRCMDNHSWNKYRCC